MSKPASVSGRAVPCVDLMYSNSGSTSLVCHTPKMQLRIVNSAVCVAAVASALKHSNSPLSNAITSKPIC